MGDSFGSPVFDPSSPPAVKSRDEIIDEIIKNLKVLLKLQISSILAACRPKQPILSFNRADRSKQAAKGGIQALHHRYKESTIRSLRQTPPGLKNTLYDLFTNAKQSDFLTDDTIKGIPPEVIENFMKIKNSELRKAADGSRQLVSKANYFRVLDLDSMSERDKKIVFEQLQLTVLLNLISDLKKGVLSAEDIGRIERIEKCIASPDLSVSIDDIFFLTNKYIEHQYNIASPHITSIEQLLKFIRDKHQILFAIMAPYYGDDSDFAKFQSYVILLDRFIFLVLKEEDSSISFEDSPDKIAEWIISIIRHNICKFVGIAGDPDLVIRTIILNRHIIPLIIKGVQDFLNDTVPDTVAPGAAEGGNRRRIKKYKNRTSCRSTRRSSRRTSRVTRYRTNRYKIKNKKTRKIR